MFDVIYLSILAASLRYAVYALLKSNDAQRALTLPLHARTDCGDRAQVTLHLSYAWPVRCAMAWALFFFLLLAGVPAVGIENAQRVLGLSLFVYLAMLLLIVTRRPRRPTPFDLALIAAGVPGLFVVYAIIQSIVWQARGF